MKHKLGLIVTLVGILLLILPNYHMDEFIETMLYVMVRYWPILLIAFGVFLSSNTKTRRRKH